MSPPQTSKIQQAILSRLEIRGQTINNLAQRAQAAGVCSPGTVYTYLGGSRSVAVETAEELAALLGLEIRIE